MGFKCRSPSQIDHPVSIAFHWHLDFMMSSISLSEGNNLFSIWPRTSNIKKCFYKERTVQD